MQTVECLRVRRRGDFCEITYKPHPGTHGASHIIAKREINVALAEKSNPHHTEPKPPTMQPDGRERSISVRPVSAR
jgi:hypothetical protein